MNPELKELFDAVLEKVEELNSAIMDAEEGNLEVEVIKDSQVYDFPRLGRKKAVIYLRAKAAYTFTNPRELQV